MKEIETEEGRIYKKDFVTELAERTGLGGKEAARVTRAFLEILTERLCAGTSVCFRGFGTFELRPIGRRLARNPRTMEDVMIQPGVKPIFRASRRLWNKVNESLTGGGIRV